VYRVVIFIFFSVTLNLWASDISLLKINKQEIIEQQKKEIEANSEKLKYDWISPLNLSTSYSKSDTDKDFISDSSIGLGQDIFRSGGIFYKIDYADIKLQNSLTSLALQNTSLYEELFIGLLKLQKLRLILEQAHYALLNSEIEVFLKTQQYKTGDVDITELNRALREKNTLLKTELTANQAIVESEIELKKLTDMELKSISIPKFTLISKDEYEKSNYNLSIASLSTEVSDKEYKIIRSNYLPTVSVNGAYGYMDNPNANFSDDYYNVGAVLSMPLDYNYDATLQESKASYMRKKLEIQDTKIDELSFYEAGRSKIKNYEEHSAVTQENIELYIKLIDIVQKALKSGLKTGYDLKTLQNTKMVDELEIEINKINIQIELAQLIFVTKNGESYYE